MVVEDKKDFCNNIFSDMFEYVLLYSLGWGGGGVAGVNRLFFGGVDSQAILYTICPRDFQKFSRIIIFQPPPLRHTVLRLRPDGQIPTLAPYSYLVNYSGPNIHAVRNKKAVAKVWLLFK